MTQQIQSLMRGMNEQTLTALDEENRRHQKQIALIMTQMDAGACMFNLEDEIAQHRARLVQIAQAARHRVVAFLDAQAPEAGIAPVVAAMSQHVVVPETLPGASLSGAQSFEQPRSGGALPA